MTMRSMFVSLGCLLGASVAAAPPSMNDYASGMSIRANHAQPLVETVLPDDVYRVVTRTDLGDLRVFNADGMPVPHAFCATPSSTAPQVTELSLPVFVLRGRDHVYTENSRVAVETSSGTRVNVEETAASKPEIVSGLIHIIDARETQPVRAIRFDWRSPDGASEVKVRIESSDDLDRWQTIVPASTLLLAQQGDQELRRERIELPSRQYQYLRVQRVDSGPPLILNSVTAEQVAAPEQIEPMWFNALAMESKEADVLYFDAQHLAPVTYARVRLAQQNSTVNVSLQSRPDHQTSWRPRWTGESYFIVSDTVRRESPPAQFQATTDRYWRLQILKDPQVYRDSTLELGYRPAKLRFFAQGPGPFTVAFGSRRAEPAQAVLCDGLLADVTASERERMIEQGFLEQIVSLGGPEALKSPPKKTPVKVVILWAVLVVGVALLVGMALSLLKRVRHPTN
nr:DUF3999 domain-containing protein [uncultured Steroidobacter sp.]